MPLTFSRWIRAGCRGWEWGQRVHRMLKKRTAWSLGPPSPLPVGMLAWELCVWGGYHMYSKLRAHAELPQAQLHMPSCHYAGCYACRWGIGMSMCITCVCMVWTSFNLRPFPPLVFEIILISRMPVPSVEWYWCFRMNALASRSQMDITRKGFEILHQWTGGGNTWEGG